MGDSKPPQRQASQAERPQLWRTDGPRIGGGRQRPAPESAPATALMRAVRRAIDVADDPRHWDVAATYRGPGSRDPFELLQAHWPQTGHGIRTQGHAQERRRRGPANHTDHANASGRHARQCYSVRSPSEDEAEAEAVKDAELWLKGRPKGTRPKMFALGTQQARQYAQAIGQAPHAGIPNLGGTPPGMARATPANDGSGAKCVNGSAGVVAWCACTSSRVSPSTLYSVEALTTGDDRHGDRRCVAGRIGRAT